MTSRRVANQADNLMIQPSQKHQKHTFASKGELAQHSITLPQQSGLTAFKQIAKLACVSAMQRPRIILAHLGEQDQRQLANNNSEPGQSTRLRNDLGLVTAIGLLCFWRPK
jgi:hypothetical protein